MNPISTEGRGTWGQRLEWAHGGPDAPREPRILRRLRSLSDPDGSAAPGIPGRPGNTDTGQTRSCANSPQPMASTRVTGAGTEWSAPWPPDTLRDVLAALGVPADGPQEQQRSLAESRLAPWRRILPPVLVLREGRETHVDVHVPHGSGVRVWIDAEDGSRHEAAQRENWDQPVDVDGVLTGRATFAIPADLGLGWHTLKADADGTLAQCPLVVTPGQLRTPARARGTPHLGADGPAVLRAVLPVLGDWRLCRSQRPRRGCR